MGNHFDIGYFKDSGKKKIQEKIALKRTIINKIIAWELNENYYDKKREKWLWWF